jgi:hypothetical protein
MEPGTQQVCVNSFPLIVHTNNCCTTYCWGVHICINEPCWASASSFEKWGCFNDVLCLSTPKLGPHEAHRQQQSCWLSSPLTCRKLWGLLTLWADFRNFLRQPRVQWWQLSPSPSLFQRPALVTKYQEEPTYPGQRRNSHVKSPSQSSIKENQHSPLRQCDLIWLKSIMSFEVIWRA